MARQLPATEAGRSRFANGAIYRVASIVVDDQYQPIPDAELRMDFRDPRAAGKHAKVVAGTYDSWVPIIFYRIVDHAGIRRELWDVIPPPKSVRAIAEEWAGQPIVEEEVTFEELADLLLGPREGGGVPRGMLKEWAKEIRLRGDDLVGDDAAFDQALDIAMFGSHAVEDEHGAIDVQQSRDFAYELLAAAGRPYGKNRWDGTKVKTRRTGGQGNCGAANANCGCGCGNKRGNGCANGYDRSQEGWWKVETPKKGESKRWSLEHYVLRQRPGLLGYELLVHGQVHDTYRRWDRATSYVNRLRRRAAGLGNVTRIVGRGKARHVQTPRPGVVQRRAMPTSMFALPLSEASPSAKARFEREWPGVKGAYPMDTMARTVNARSRAVSQLNAGYITAGDARTILQRTYDRAQVMVRERFRGWRPLQELDLVRGRKKWRSVPATEVRRGEFRGVANRLTLGAYGPGLRYLRAPVG